MTALPRGISPLAATALVLAAACGRSASDTRDPSAADSAGFDFAHLMGEVAEGWSTNDTERALHAFTADAVYMEPPDLMLFRNHGELRRFFDAVNPGSSMTWHHLWFDAASGIGAGEYTFHNGGRTTAAHGVAVVEIRDRKIALWREYQRRGAIAYPEFLDIESKRWQTTVNTLP